MVGNEEGREIVQGDKEEDEEEEGRRRRRKGHGHGEGVRGERSEDERLQRGAEQGPLSTRRETVACSEWGVWNVY